ncbi:unnamed protein product, partial [Brassicogethes aeneus]
QAVSSRIPQFSSRIPQIAQTAPAAPAAQKPAEITSKHLGCRVKVGDKQGVLRFVGAVNFAKGTWCGVELNGEIGKNDGSVNGVRYFECAPRCGLMAPLCKTALLDACEKLDEDSGPYSMLFLQSHNKAKTEINFTQENNLNETFDKGVDDLNETFFIGGSDDLNQTVVLSKTVVGNNDTYQLKNSEAENHLKRKTFNLDIKQKNSDNQNTFVVNNTFDVSKAASLEKTFVNRSFENLPNEAKRRKINNQKNSDNITLDQPTDTTYSSPSSLDLVNHSTPAKVEPLKFDLRKVRISGITLDANNTEDDKSKRDSLDFEESLGILTPDQMVEDYINHLKLGFEAQQEKDKTLEHDKTPSPGILEETLINNATRLSPQDFSFGILEETLINNATRRESSGKYMNKLNESFLKFKLPNECKEPDISSPNLVDASVTEYSLGILDEHMLSNMSAAADNMNLALPLENTTASKDYRLSRIEQTPSPEDLPLDPTPVVTVQEELLGSKEDAKSKPLNSFITSITSITSLDTGYQGDGEMSRPASRGADNSPMTRRPLPKPQNHRQDPMTDSDFYTESDADNHEDHHLKGDRKAQVIDGTLYGVDAQAAADIYANNRENMDSSGIFTDAEINTRAEELNETFDVSPSDTSIKTVSENSQKKQENVPKVATTPKQILAKRASSTPTSTPSLQSPKSAAKDNSFLKKHKMPKRDVPSKIKTMLVPNQSPVPSERKTVKKAGKWDAVMDKISKNEQNKNNLKDVKSKVFNASSMQNENNKSAEKNLRQTPNSKTPNSKLTYVKSNILTVKHISNNNVIDNYKKLQTNLTGTIKLQSRTYKTIENNRPTVALSRDIKPKTIVPKIVNNKKKTDIENLNLRRTRVRTNAANTPRKNLNLESSIHSSLSDVSSPAQQLSKKNSEKKKLINTPNDVKTKKYVVSAKEKKTESPKISDNRNNVKPSRQLIVGPSKRNQTTSKEDHRIVEALAILVQHLVFNVDAFSAPALKRELNIQKSEKEEWKKSYETLEESINNEKSEHLQALEEERALQKKQLEDLIESHTLAISNLKLQHEELEARLTQEKENATKRITKQHEDQLTTLKSEFSRLQQNYEERLDILREENEAIREQIDEKKQEVDGVRRENAKIRRELDGKSKEREQKVDAEKQSLEEAIAERTKVLNEENERLRKENERLLSYGDEKGIGIQEVQSLRAVLEIKQRDVSDLRKSLGEATQKLEILENAEERANFLSAKCEDLKSQLERKLDIEQSLVNENCKLQESFSEERKQKARLSQHNEELQWKLKKSKEVMNSICQLTGDNSTLNRSLLYSSLNEKHCATKQNLERSSSFKEHSFNEGSVAKRRYKTSLTQDFEDDDSPPSSPKVKGVVEKSDSVSYVLDLDESPDIVASRIVRRSFRNSTPPKTTPTKSPTGRTPTRNAVSLSSSASSVTSSKSSRNDQFFECQVNSSVFAWTSTPRANSKLDDNSDLDEEETDVDLDLPALPSELDRQRSAQALPSPKHLAGEAMISESASEDESTSSSQL